MEDQKSIRLQAGCAMLFLFDLLALCGLLYLSFVGGWWFPMDCTVEHERACDAARAANLRTMSVVLWTTVAVNVGFVVWAFWQRSRPSK